MNVRVSQNRAALVWLVQAASGILLLILLFVHLIANHYLVPGGLRGYQEVVDYLSNPLILVLELLFLVVVTIHALLGVRAILLDRGVGGEELSRLDRRLSIIGVAAVTYGGALSIAIIT